MQNICKDINEFKQKLVSKTRIIAVDVGKTKIGLAKSDEDWVFAFPDSIIKLPNPERVRALFADKLISGVVVGWPLELNGAHGVSCKMVEEFVNKYLSQSELAILLHDERMTTKLAQTKLRNASVVRRKRDAIDDAVSAHILLEEVLAKINMGR